MPGERPRGFELKGTNPCGCLNWNAGRGAAVHACGSMWPLTTEGAMHRRMLVPLLALILLFGVFVTPSAAITGGQPDGEGHPYVALLLAPVRRFAAEH